MTGDMVKTAQRKAAANYRKRTREKGLVRVEIQVPADDAPLIRDLAERLRAPDVSATVTRNRLISAMERHEEPKSVLDVFGSDLPDEYFEGVFDHVRTTSNRKIDW